jgi:ferric-dicitrate binding protein FerR (iron transport regulator)
MNSFDLHSLEEQTRLVSRYVAGDLSRSERADFEAWLVASPELAAEVELERRLRLGIASAARRGWLKRGTEAPATAGLSRRWRIGIAASIGMLIITVGISVLMPERGSAQLAANRSGSNVALHLSAARTVRLGSVRGFGASPDVIVTRSDMPRELTIEPDVVVLTCEDGSIDLECAGGTAPHTPQYAEYEMDVVNRGDSALAWRSPRQLATAGTTLSFVMPDPEKLGTGDFDMLVRGHSPDHEEVVARFWLRMTDK